MIEYENPTNKDNIMYFASDGSYGTPDDILIVDVTELDGHFSEFLDELSDWQLPSFMRWYVDNQTHDQDPSDYSACKVCDAWQSGSEDEIIEMLGEEE